MFKKLRIKFIAITMAMVAVVMALAFVSVCVIEWQRSLSVVETALSDAAMQAMSSEAPRQDNHSLRPDGFGGDDFDGDDFDGDDFDGDDFDGDDFFENDFDDDRRDEGMRHEDSLWDDLDEVNIAPPAIGMRGGEPRNSSSLIPVAAYSVSSNGDISLVAQVTSATISNDLLQEAVELAKDAPDGFGEFSNLGLDYYKVSSDGQVYLTFTDTSYADGWKSLALMLTLVGVITLLVFFLISLVYSRWALKPVREAWDSQRQFVADASHDLKTPITVILANAAILLKHPERTIASESQWIESTQVEAENMQGLVNEMLELASVEAGEKREVEKESIDFSDLVDGETLLFDSVALERGCAFECRIDQGVRVIGNVPQVQKMVATIVENAFKYVDEGGAVDIELKRAGKYAELAVRNSGSVIAPEDLPHIFDRFYRTDKARTSGAGGFGLGLAIAKEIAVQQGGDITCSSDLATGTTFTIKLPVE